MKNFYSFLALLTLCTAAAFASDEIHSKMWWQEPNPTVTLENGKSYRAEVIVDYPDMAVGIIVFPGYPSVWAAFTENGATYYNPQTNQYGDKAGMYIFRSIDDLLNPQVRARVSPSFNLPAPQQPAPQVNVTDNPAQQNQHSAETELPNNNNTPDNNGTGDQTVDHNDQQNPQQSHQPDESNVDDTPKSEGLITSTIDFLTGKQFLVTVSASTCAAVAAFYAADWYNTEFIKEKTEKKIDRRYAAAIAGMSTAVICGGYFYYTATP